MRLPRLIRYPLIFCLMATMSFLTAELLVRFLYSARYRSFAYLTYGIGNVFSYDVAQFKKSGGGPNRTADETRAP